MKETGAHKRRSRREAEEDVPHRPRSALTITTRRLAHSFRYYWRLEKEPDGSGAAACCLTSFFLLAERRPVTARSPLRRHKCGSLRANRVALPAEVIKRWIEYQGEADGAPKDSPVFLFTAADRGGVGTNKYRLPPPPPSSRRLRRRSCASRVDELAQGHPPSPANPTGTPAVQNAAGESSAERREAENGGAKAGAASEGRGVEEAGTRPSGERDRELGRRQLDELA